MTDFNTMLISLAPSLDPIQKLVSGFAYILGIVFAFKALHKLRDASNFHAQGGGRTKMAVPIGYMVGAMALLFLPTMVDVTRVTFFGVESPLEYASWFNELLKQYGNSTYIVTKLVETAGVIWFVRGCVLLIHTAEPGSQHGSKGLAFLVAGILAINFMYTATLVSSTMDYFVSQIHQMFPPIQAKP